jgi:hypothetical protein
MRNEIDPRIAENIMATAVSSVWALPSEKIVCTRRAFREAVATAIQHAYEIGLLAGQEARFRESTRAGSADRPSWMDIRLDDERAMAAQQLRLWPVMLRSLHDKGYKCLGDLRWVPLEQLIRVFYIGRITAKQIRAAIERLERGGHVAPG